MKEKLWEEFTRKLSATRLTNIILSQNGQRIYEHHFLEEHRRNIYSATKSFTSTAVGIALKEGLLSLDEKITDCFPEEIPEQPSQNLQQLRVEHLLNMSVGQAEPFLMGEKRPFLKEKDWVRYVLSQPFEHRPGSRFLYSNTGPYLAGILISRRAGCSMADYLQARVFDPLGWHRVTWEVDPLGNTFGAGGLFLTTTELLQFGELYLYQGLHHGKQLVPQEWVQRVKRPQIQSEEKQEGYSFLFWNGQHASYRASGKYGQYSIVMEDKNAVLAIQAESVRHAEFMDLFWNEVYPNL